MDHLASIQESSQRSLEYDTVAKTIRTDVCQKEERCCTKQFEQNGNKAKSSYPTEANSEQDRGKGDPNDDDAVAERRRVAIVDSRETREYQREEIRCKKELEQNGNEATLPTDHHRSSTDDIARPGAVPVAGIDSGLDTGRDSRCSLQTRETSNYSQTIPGALTRESVDLIEARPLSASEVFNEYHHTIHANTTTAEIIGTKSTLQLMNSRHDIIKWAVLVCISGCILVSVVILAFMLKDDAATSEDIGPSTTPTSANTSIGTPTLIPTLTTITDNGKIRCGVGWLDKLEEDLCRILAAVVIGDSERVEIVKLRWTKERWEALDNGTIDILTMLSTSNMDRDIFQRDLEVGFSFSDPFFYDGVTFGGIPPYGECADNLNGVFGVCSGVRVCVTAGSSTYTTVSDLLPNFNIRPVAVYEDLYSGLSDGRCNVIAEGKLDVSENRVREMGYNGTYEVGQNTFSKSPLSVVMRENDPQWVDFVNFVLRALVTAEEQGITNVTAPDFYTTTLFGKRFENMFIDAIGVVGNYGQIYEKHLERILPREGPNLINNGSTGLLYSHPLSFTSQSVPNPMNGSMIRTIRERGVLRCGIPQRIVSSRTIFIQKLKDAAATTKGEDHWKGINADYCYALAASLFQGNNASNVIEFIAFSRNDNPFVLLYEGKVDVLAGITVDAEVDVMEPTTRTGYTFSVPYLYKTKYDTPTSTHDEAISLVTGQDDPQWSSFVHWIVSVTFFAEEKSVTMKSSFSDMPLVYVFGPELEHMFRHAIGRVGNYDEIYTRNIDNDSLRPREGSRNLLNRGPFYGPQQVPFLTSSLEKFQAKTTQEDKKVQPLQRHDSRSRSVVHLRMR